MDRRLPWLKWSSLPIAFALALGSIRTGTLRVPPPLHQRVGDLASARIAVMIALAYLMLGLVSFGSNFFIARDPETRRKFECKRSNEENTRNGRFINGLSYTR